MFKDNVTLIQTNIGSQNNKMRLPINNFDYYPYRTFTSNVHFDDGPRNVASLLCKINYCARISIGVTSKRPIGLCECDWKGCRSEIDWHGLSIALLKGVHWADRRTQLRTVNLEVGNVEGIVLHSKYTGDLRVRSSCGFSNISAEIKCSERYLLADAYAGRSHLNKKSSLGVRGEWLSIRRKRGLIGYMPILQYKQWVRIRPTAIWVMNTNYWAMHVVSPYPHIQKVSMV